MKRLLAFLLLCAMPITPVFAQANPPADPLEAERLEQSGTVITIIFDDSGSMEGAKIAQAKAAFRSWIERVPAEYRLSLIALNGGSLVPPGRNNRAQILAAMERIRANGSTPLVQTLRTAMGQIEARRQQVGPYERQIIVVFTDGQDTSTEGNPGVQRQLQAARVRNIETVGIGFKGEGDYMRGSATRYYNASNAEELRTSLAKVDAEIGDTSDVVIDAPTLAQMKNAGVSPAAVLSPAPGANASRPTAPDTAPIQQPPQSSVPARRFRVNLFLAAIIVIFLFRLVAKIIQRR